MLIPAYLYMRSLQHTHLVRLQEDVPVLLRLAFVSITAVIRYSRYRCYLLNATKRRSNYAAFPTEFAGDVAEISLTVFDDAPVGKP